MTKPLDALYQTIQKLIGLHRQLLDTVRLERKALVDAVIKDIQDTTCAKQALIEAIRQCESERMKLMAALAAAWKKPLGDLNLSTIAIAVQGEDMKAADQFRSSQNTLTILIQRIVEQNSDNKALVEKSLSHVHEMKRNVLGEAIPKSNTYNPQGQRSATTGGARLISKEV